jgi:hypothetical protein
MLPKEIGNLYAALNNSTETTLDAQRLGAELEGVATFHRSLIDDDLLTLQQRELFQTYVGKWHTGNSQEVGLTAPPEGPPEIHLRFTALRSGRPRVSDPINGPPVECPLCHKFIVER